MVLSWGSLYRKVLLKPLVFNEFGSLFVVAICCFPRIASSHILTSSLL